MTAPHLLLEATEHVLILRYTTVATLCFVTYEYLINLDYEIRYLWPRRFNIGFVLLFFCRYLQIATIFVSAYAYVWTSDVRQSHCSALIKTTTSLVYCQFCLSIFALGARSYTVWKANKWIRALLLGSIIGVAIPTAYAMYLYTHGVSYPGLIIWNGCIYLFRDHDGALAALIGHAFMDMLMLGLLLFKSVQHTRFINSLSNRSGKVSILTVMAEDGIKYFIFNLICTLINMIGVERFPSDLHGFLLTTQACVENVLCARLYFHLQIVNEGWTMNATGIGANTNNLPIYMKTVAGGTIKFAETSAVGAGFSVQDSVRDGDIVEESRSTTQGSAN